MAWFRDEAALQRMQELITAYRDDPTDQETCLELGGLRRVVAQLWLDVDPSQLQTLRHTAVGDVTCALIVSGFGAELVDEVDRRGRDQLSARATDFTQPSAAGVLLAALLFVPLEAVTIEGVNALPDWCVALLQDIAA